MVLGRSKGLEARVVLGSKTPQGSRLEDYDRQCSARTPTDTSGNSQRELAKKKLPEQLRHAPVCGPLRRAAPSLPAAGSTRGPTAAAAVALSSRAASSLCWHNMAFSFAWFPSYSYYITTFLSSDHVSSCAGRLVVMIMHFCNLREH